MRILIKMQLALIILAVACSFGVVTSFVVNSLLKGWDLTEESITKSILVPKEELAREIEETSGMVLKSAHPTLSFNGEVLGVLA